VPSMTNCPFCGKLTDPRLDNCVHCGGVLRKASPGQAAPGNRAEDASASQTCPNCHALVQAGDIICVACGTNLLTGQKISAERAPAPTRRSRGPLLYAGAVILGAIILVGAGVGLYVLLRNPIDYAVQLSAQGRNSEAVAVLENYLAKRPGNARGQFELARLYWGAGQYQRAAQAFEKVGPRNRVAVLMQAASLHAMNDANTRKQEAAAFARLTQEFPDDAQAWRLLALARGTSGDYPGMTEALKRAQTLSPATSDLRTLLGVGDALARDYAAAAQELDAVLREKPETSDALVVRGMLYWMEGKADDALAALQEAFASAVSLKTLAGTQAGLILVQKGEYKKAIEYLEQVRNQPDADPAASFFYASALFALQFFPDAVAEFEKLVSAKGPYAKEAAVQLARASIARDDIEKARQALEQASVLGAQGAEVDTLRGRILLMTGDETGAQGAFRKAVSVDPRYAPAHLENGLLYIRRQAVEEGIEELQTYLDLIGPEGTDREVEMLVSQLKTASDRQTGSAPENSAAPQESGAPSPDATNAASLGASASDQRTLDGRAHS